MICWRSCVFPALRQERFLLSLSWPLVKLYSGCDLSRISNRETAVLGLAKLFSAVSDSCLIFGLWEGRLAADSSWRTTDPGPDQLVSGTPSWSLLSIDGRVKNLQHNQSPLSAEIVGPPFKGEIDSIFLDSNVRTQQSRIRIRASLTRSRIQRLPVFLGRIRR